jgi:hypothetical protein
VTGLIWLKNANCFGELDYVSANNVAAGLKDGECGLSDNSSSGDWRLATKAEWVATVAQANALLCMYPNLTDTPGTDCYASGTQPFTGVQSGGYWSSAAFETDPSHAWYMYLGIGTIGVYNKTQEFYVWPVRGGQ